jgi:PPOX class probable F420-dependent enzyme
MRRPYAGRRTEARLVVALAPTRRLAHGGAVTGSSSPEHLRAGLERARTFGARESGLAVVTTVRTDGTPHSSVVNVGVVVHPVTGQAVVAFVARGAVRKLVHLRERPQATVVFRSGWDWVAIDGDAELAGPDDPLEGLDADGIRGLLRDVYAAAAGGTADDWAALDDTMAAERHTAVLLRPVRAYPAE